MKVSSKFREIIRRCQRKPRFFIENFGKIKHPTAGIIPFKLFKYQRGSLDLYQSNRYTIYRKCRQSGISTLAGMFALWLAMFRAHVTILVVSKTERDSKEFFARNIAFPFKQLPKEFQDKWVNSPQDITKHQAKFKNGSSIVCLPSGADVLRSNSSTLNIIDESGFMPDMGEMWAAGQPTLIMGGSVIVISTCNGKGNWYHNTWESAKHGFNDFQPIEVMWWDMDWVVEFDDPNTRQRVRIAPTDGIRPTTETEKDIYGPYWSPWLEAQYRAMKERGESHLFRQEYLADFLGSGNTVIPTEVLEYIDSTIKKPLGSVHQASYVHPVTEQRHILDFEDQLHIYAKPVEPTDDKIKDGRVIEPGEPGHTYVMGVDVATGESSDYSSIVIFDVDNREQVADLKIKVTTTILSMMIDYIGRYYNGAFCVPERTGYGEALCQELRDNIGYHNLFRRKTPQQTRDKKVGFPTNAASKPTIDKHLRDMLGEDGFQIYSFRIYQEMQMYVYLTEKKTGNEPGSGNHDDMVIASGLALLGVADAVQMDTSSMIPTRGTDIIVSENAEPNRKVIIEQYGKFAAKGGMNLLMPIIPMQSANASPQQAAEEEFQKFTEQLGGMTMQQARMPVSKRRHVIKRGKYSR